MNRNMNYLIGTIVVIVVCAGYYIYRKKHPLPPVLNVLTLHDIFQWIDTLFLDIEKDNNTTYEVNILPNADTIKLIHSNDRRAYAAILKQEKAGEMKVIMTKIFYANSLDKDLNSLYDNQIVVIPIEQK